jgi:hypothetical protein
MTVVLTLSKYHSGLIRVFSQGWLYAAEYMDVRERRRPRMALCRGAYDCVENALFPL